MIQLVALFPATKLHLNGYTSIDSSSINANKLILLNAKVKAQIQILICLRFCWLGYCCCLCGCAYMRLIIRLTLKLNHSHCPHSDFFFVLLNETNVEDLSRARARTHTHWATVSRPIIDPLFIERNHYVKHCEFCHRNHAKSATVSMSNDQIRNA